MQCLGPACYSISKRIPLPKQPGPFGCCGFLFSQCAAQPEWEFSSFLLVLTHEAPPLYPDPPRKLASPKPPPPYLYSVSQPLLSPWISVGQLDFNPMFSSKVFATEKQSKTKPNRHFLGGFFFFAIIVGKQLMYASLTSSYAVLASRYWDLKRQPLVLRQCKWL